MCVCVWFETLLSLSINNTVFILFCSFSDIVFSSNVENSEDFKRFRVNCHLRLNIAIKKKEDPSATSESPYYGAAQ